MILETLNEVLGQQGEGVRKLISEQCWCVSKPPQTDQIVAVRGWGVRICRCNIVWLGEERILGGFGKPGCPNVGNSMRETK